MNRDIVQRIDTAQQTVSDKVQMEQKDTQVKKDADTAAEHLIVGFVGLPSAGKSTLVNALVGKRIMATGVCRTTTAVHMIGPKNIFNFSEDRFHLEHIVCDSKIPFSILDMPGVADAENSSKSPSQNFDEMTSAWISHCDVVYWVTDINTAFLTTHEKKEFDRIFQQLQNLTKETGTLYQIAILLSKFDWDDSSISPQCEKKESNILSGEIADEDEDTTAKHCLQRVRTLFQDIPQIRLIKFNGFGRILHREDSSAALKSLVTKLRVAPSSINIRFDLEWASKDLKQKQQSTLLQFLWINFKKFMDGQLKDFEKLKLIIPRLQDPEVLREVLTIVTVSSNAELNADRAKKNSIWRKLGL